MHFTSMLPTSILHTPYPPAAMDDLFLEVKQMEKLSTVSIEEKISFFRETRYPVYQGLWRLYREYRRASHGETDRRLENLFWRFWGNETLQNSIKKWNFENLVYRIENLADPTQNPLRTGYQVDIKWRAPKRIFYPRALMKDAMPEFQPSAPITIMQTFATLQGPPQPTNDGTVPMSHEEEGYYFPSYMCTSDEWGTETPTSSTSTSTETAGIPLGLARGIEGSLDAEFHWFDPALFELDGPADQSNGFAAPPRCRRPGHQNGEPIAEGILVPVPVRSCRKARRRLILSLLLGL